MLRGRGSERTRLLPVEVAFASGSVETVDADPARETVAPGPPAGPVCDTAPRPHRWGLGAFVLVELGYLLTAALFGPVFVGASRFSAAKLAVAVAVPAVIAAGLALLITRLRGNGPRIDLHVSWSWRALRLGLLCGLGGLLVTIPASMVYAQLVGPHANSAVGKVFGGVRASWPWAVVVFVIVAFVAPLCEEIIYRGLLWGALDRRWGRWTAFAVTTIVFALAHLEFTRAPLLVIVTIPIGLARLYADNLWASIVTHQVTNLLPATALMLSLVGVMPSQ